MSQADSAVDTAGGPANKTMDVEHLGLQSINRRHGRQIGTNMSTTATSNAAQKHKENVQFYNNMGYSPEMSERLARSAFPEDAAAASASRKHFSTGLNEEAEETRQAKLEKAFESDWHKNPALKSTFATAAIYAGYCMSRMGQLARIRGVSVESIEDEFLKPQAPSPSSSTSAANPPARSSATPTSRRVAMPSRFNSQQAAAVQAVLRRQAL